MRPGNALEVRLGAPALAALLWLGGCKDEAHDAPVPVRPVLVVDAKMRTTQVLGPFAGTVEPRYQSNHGFRTAGRIIARDVNVGDLVRKGDRLAALDETILRFALVQAQADVKNAEAQVKSADATQDRKNTLIRTGAVAQSDVDSASADQKTSGARREQARAALERAQDNLGYAGVYAEYDGVVTAWSAEVGQDVSQGAIVVTLARPDHREAVVDIPDVMIGQVRENDAFTVVLQSSNAVTAKGLVREIAPSADSATRTRRIRFTLDKPSSAFRLGSTVTVSLESPITPRVEIPEAALLSKDGGTAVWIVGAGADRVFLRTVAVIGRENGTVAVTGPGEGDRVVTAGIHRLTDGQPVKVITSFP